MKLNVKNIRYLSTEDWRVLTATEMGSRNHEVVPTTLIAQLAHIRSGSGVNRCISNLAKIDLIARVKNASYDGYRLTYGGLDYLALHSHTKTNVIYSVGNQVGVGKESDIYACAQETGKQLVLKIHRLGRISFRTVKANRDYLKNNSGASWMDMSRLAAVKEYEFMKVLRREGFPVPEPIGQNRHTVVMEMINAFPMRQISDIGDSSGLYAELLSLIVQLAQYGLIHGDFNEFNVLVEIRENEDTGVVEALIPTIIDFPQMISIDHENADFYFDRDVACVKRFFSRRFGFTSDEPGPFLKESIQTIKKRLDVEVQASGFSKKMAKELAAYMKKHNVDGDAGERDPEDEDDDAASVGEQPDVDTLSNPDTDDAPNEIPHDEPAAAAEDPLPTDLSPEALAASMTILDIRDNDPTPTLDEIKAAQPPVISTRTAKKNAGWAI